MDSIKVELSYDETSDDEEEQNFRFLCASMHLNGVPLKETVYLISLLEDKNGEYEIFTCSCGIAGCAGIWEGIKVKFRKHTVEWRIPRNAGYDFLDKTFYSFSRKEWGDMCAYIRYAVKELAKLEVHDQFTHWACDFDKLSNRLENYGVK